MNKAFDQIADAEETHGTSVGGHLRRAGFASRSGGNAENPAQSLDQVSPQILDRLDLMLVQQMRSVSFQLLAQYNQPQFVQARDLIDRLPEDIEPARIREDQSLRQAAELVLGYYEDVAIAVQERAADERTLYLSLLRVAQTDWLRLGSYANQKRDDLCSEIFRGAEELAGSWSRGEFLSTGREVDPDLPLIDILCRRAAGGAPVPVTKAQ
jgi:hypothetical protein